MKGGSGDDYLDGGADADTLYGGIGDDTFIVDNVADTVAEYAGEGTADTVAAALSYTLAAGLDIEILSTTNDEGTGAINLTGNELAQTLTGNAGANRLDGKGGADTMSGLKGNDFYFVDDAADQVIEAAGGGTDDRVLASLSYTLAAGQQIEVLGTTSASGTGAINLTGNELAQTLYGNAGTNRLDGKGGADTMSGLGGNDFYFVDNAADKVMEAAGGGTDDRVLANLSYTLAAGQQIEVLATTTSSGTGAINLTGNELAQTLYGNAGANVLDGRGGADTLMGYGGADTFLLRSLTDSAVASAGRDVIKDFSHAQHDRIDLHLIDANTTVSGNQAFTFIGSAAYGHRAGELRAVTSGSTTLVIGDVNGDAVSDFAITVNKTTFASDDFVL